MMIMENIPNTWGSLMRERAEKTIVGKEKEIFPLLVKVFSLEKKCKVDCVIVTTAHNEFKEMQLEDLARMMNDKPVLIDVRGIVNNQEAEEKYYGGL